MIAISYSDRSSEPDPQDIAIGALSFLAGQPEELSRFLNLCGIDPADLRQSATDPAFLGGLLDFFLQDEALLLVFAEASGIDPAAISTARRRLDSPSREPS
jgi:hypothetical protein